MNSEPHTLSSPQTFVMKFWFPIIWIGGFAIATLSLFVFPNAWRHADGELPQPGMKWLFMSATLVWAVFLLRVFSRLKQVRLDAAALYISNYFTEVVVPLLNVAKVTGHYWLGRQAVTIRFHSATQLGSQVTFIPTTRWHGDASSHPAAEEIRLAVDRAAGRDRA